VAIQDHCGQCICGFSQHIGVSTSVAAKLQALRDGLSLASFMGFSDFIVELDALVKVHPNLSLVVDDYMYLFRKITYTEVSMFLGKQKGVLIVCLVMQGCCID
jgi:hypothetical protein